MHGLEDSNYSNFQFRYEFPVVDKLWGLGFMGLGFGVEGFRRLKLRKLNRFLGYRVFWF